MKEVDFLGHRVDFQGLRPLETKVSAIRDFPKPSTVKDLRKISRGHQLLSPFHTQRRWNFAATGFSFDPGKRDQKVRTM